MSDFNKYQIKAKEFETEGNKGLLMGVLGLVTEAGEVADKLYKANRDNDGKLDALELMKEIGDVLWNVSKVARDLGYSLQEVADMNIAKLESRKARGNLSGSGDNR